MEVTVNSEVVEILEATRSSVCVPTSREVTAWSTPKRKLSGLGKLTSFVFPLNLGDVK